VNRYAYHAQVLILVYAVAILIALVSSIIGLYTYLRLGVTHDRSISDFLALVQRSVAKELFPTAEDPELPILEDIRKRKVQLLGDTEHGYELRYETLGSNSRSVELSPLLVSPADPAPNLQ
jgi:hypothetical protein